METSKTEKRTEPKEKLFKKRDLIWIIGGIAAAVFIIVLLAMPAKIISKEEAIQIASEVPQVKDFMKVHPEATAFALEQDCAADKCPFQGVAWLVNYQIGNQSKDYVDVFVGPKGNIVAVKP